MNLYTFHREGYFYPIEIESDKVALGCVKCNPGTIKVIRHYPLPETVLFEQVEQKGAE